MSTPTQQELYGNFTSDLLTGIIDRYLEILPEEDLPTESILNTTLLFLRGLFYYLDEEHEYKWRGDIYGEQDEDETGIVIECADAIDGERLEFRPAILVNLQSRRFVGLHLNQLKHFYLPEHMRTVHDLIAGSVTASVVSRETAVARRLADWLGLSFRLLVDYLTFSRFHSIHPQIVWSDVQSAGELVRSSDHEYRMASVSFNYQWPWTGRVSTRQPTTFNRFVGEIVAYGRPVLDPPDPGDGIVEPTFTQLLDEEIP